MNTRLKQFLAAENITQAQFADTINVVRASVSHVLSGRNNPSYEFIRSVMLKYPSLNIEWLMFGKGKMYKDSNQTEDNLFSDISELQPHPDGNLFEYEQTPEEEVAVPDKTEQTKVNVPESAAQQRKVSKIIVLFDDGTYQEM